MQNESMVTFPCFLRNMDSSRMNDRRETFCFTTAFLHVSVCKSRWKDWETTSPAAPRLKNAITIDPRILANAVLTGFYAALFQGWRMPTRASMTLDLRLRLSRKNANNFLNNQIHYFPLAVVVKMSEGLSKLACLTSNCVVCIGSKIWSRDRAITEARPTSSSVLIG